MSVLLVGSGTVKSTSTTDRNATVAIPGGVSAGDLLHLVVHANTAATMTTPSGWTLVRRIVKGTAIATGIFQRFFVAGDSAPVSVMSADGLWLAQIMAHSGVNRTSPFLAENGQQEGTTTTTVHSAPALVNSDPGAVGIAAFCSRGATPISWSPGAGLTELQDQDAAAASLNLAACIDSTTTTVPTGSVTFSATCSVTAINATMWAALLRPNTAPTVDAGADITGSTGVTYTRTATASDIEGDSLTYSWSVPAGVSIISGGSAATVGVQATTAGSYTIACTVSDSGGLSASDAFILTASANQPPTVNVGRDRSAVVGVDLAVSATASDPEGQALTYAWTSTPATGLLFTGPVDDIATTFHATAAGTYVVTCTVTDPGGVSAYLFHT